MEISNFERKAQELLDMATEKGLASDFLFSTTFDRYRTQIYMLEKCKKDVESQSPSVTKTYVKGSDNLQKNPTYDLYIRICDSANKTVGTLIRILKSFDGKQDKDPLIEMLNDDSEKEEFGVLDMSVFPELDDLEEES